MKHAMIPLVSLAAACTLGGCAMSREDRLHARADRISDSLLSERDQAMKLSPIDPRRPERLAHLSSLRTTLSAVNIGLGAVRYLPEARREVGYDVIEEAYSTIEWNIPLGPGEAPRPMPSQFVNGVLKLD